MGFLLKAFKRWTADVRGNTALVVALAAMLLVSATGGAIDFSQAYGYRSRLQDATDAGVLAAAIDPSKTEAQMQVVADKAYDENTVGLGSATRKLTKSTDIKGNTVLYYTASTKVPTQFLGMIGMDYIPINTLSKSDATIRNTEIAFVLDSTGSMSSSSKMVNLKSSVAAMLTGLLDGTGANSSNTKVTIVPFDTQVRIAPGTSLSYIDYGTADNSESCTSTGTKCNVILDVYGKVCYANTRSGLSTSSVKDCKATSKLYYRTYSTGGKTYYEAFAAASYSGSIYTYSLKVTPTTTTSSCTSTNTETGQTSTGTCSSTTWTVVQSGSRGTDSSLYNNAPTVSDGNGSYSPVPLSFITYPVTYGNGYGYKAEQSYRTGGVYGGSGTYKVGSTTTTYSDLGAYRWINKPETQSNKSAWTGCVIDRYSDTSKKTVSSYDTSADSAVSSITNSLYPARPCANGNNLKTALELTTNIGLANGTVQSMSPSGNTNITIGMQWGMEALSPDAPLVGGSAWKTPLYTKYIILVTDGDNTKSRNYSGSDINTRTALACQAAKDKGIIVFTVRVMEGDSDLLSKCASSTSYYYDLSSASQLGDTMKTILKSIRKIKLAQ